MCQGFGASWRYLSGGEAVEGAQPPAQEAVYTLRFIDAGGAPVSGVIVNICSDTFCFAPAVTGTDGTATFTGAPYAYEVHVLHAPAGYQWDDHSARCGRRNGADAEQGVSTREGPLLSSVKKVTKNLCVT